MISALYFDEKGNISSVHSEKGFSTTDDMRALATLVHSYHDELDFLQEQDDDESDSEEFSFTIGIGCIGFPSVPPPPTVNNLIRRNISMFDPQNRVVSATTNFSDSSPLWKAYDLSPYIQSPIADFDSMDLVDVVASSWHRATGEDGKFIDIKNIYTDHPTVEVPKDDGKVYVFQLTPIENPE